MPKARPLRVALAALLALAACACRREERNFRPAPPFADAADFERDYQHNAYSLAEGKRLFSFFNCVGCHGYGGGGMGPPLLDEKWFYGHEPKDVFETITRGRPNGMPAFGAKTTAHQRWQLVAYVRSLSGQARADAAPGRNDDMWANPPEHTKDREAPITTGPPRDGTEPPK